MARVVNSQDNCVNEPNRNQRDTDSDGIGDVCDQEESRITEKYPWIPWLGIGFEIVSLESEQDEAVNYAVENGISDLPACKIGETIIQGEKFDASEEYKISQTWIKNSSKKLMDIYKSWLPQDVNRTEFIELTKIPYIPYLTNIEKVVSSIFPSIL